MVLRYCGLDNRLVAVSHAIACYRQHIAYLGVNTELAIDIEILATVGLKRG